MEPKEPMRIQRELELPQKDYVPFDPRWFEDSEFRKGIIRVIEEEKKAREAEAERVMAAMQTSAPPPRPMTQADLDQVMGRVTRQESTSEESVTVTYRMTEDGELQRIDQRLEEVNREVTREMNRVFGIDPGIPGGDHSIPVRAGYTEEEPGFFTKMWQSLTRKLYDDWEDSMDD